MPNSESTGPEDPNERRRLDEESIRDALFPNLTIEQFRALVERMGQELGNVPPDERETENVTFRSRNFRDRNSPVWDMSQERIFLESLMNQRFTFFVAVFSAVIAGVLNAKSQFYLKSVLVIGAAVELLLWPLIFRAQYKLNLIVNYLMADDSHPMTIIEEEVRTRARCIASWVMSSRVRQYMVGVAVPLVCCAILIFGASVALMGKLEVPSQGSVSTQDFMPSKNASANVQARLVLLQGRGFKCTGVVKPSVVLSSPDSTPVQCDVLSEIRDNKTGGMVIPKASRLFGRKNGSRVEWTSWIAPDGAVAGDAIFHDAAFASDIDANSDVYEVTVSRDIVVRNDDPD
jgi:hypothetical protein